MSKQETRIQHLGSSLDVVTFHPMVEPKPQGPSCKIPDIRQFERSVDKYDSDLTILGRLLAIDGVKPQEVSDREREEAVANFRQSGDRQTRMEAHSVVVDMIEARLPQQLDTYFTLYRALVIEGGNIPTHIADDIVKGEKAKVQSKSRLERYETLIGVKSDTDTMLTSRVSDYMKRLKDILIRTGRTQLDVDGEISMWQNRFNRAPDDIKPKVAFRLREKLENAVRIEFNSLLFDYGFLPAYGQAKSVSIPPATWQAKFNEVIDADKKIDIVRALRDAVEIRRKNLRAKLLSIPLEA